MTAVLVTGAAGDIGAATAEALGRDGHVLALADHPEAESGLDASRPRLGRRVGGTARCVEVSGGSA